uniref:Soluble scavenger receptor cysteine-rich domain-containing protein SSC5D n=1 Tax=Eptatretus burgeri TaxID=7764 RepID=A0A8C4QH23_EPTBU
MEKQNMTEYYLWAIYLLHIDGMVRLRDGWSSVEGRVEVYLDGRWGTVCSDGWDMADANVVCHSLGFHNATAALLGATFGEGSGPINLANVNCKGNEVSILDCQANPIRKTDCKHWQDAGVRCQGMSDFIRTFWVVKGLSLCTGGKTFSLYSSGVGCDRDITILNLSDDSESSGRGPTFCVHNLVLSLGLSRKLKQMAEENSEKEFFIHAHYDCMDNVDTFLRYLYTGRVELSRTSAICLHRLASWYEAEHLQKATFGQLAVFLATDPSFTYAVQLYNYSVAMQDAPLQDICQQFLAWHGENFMNSSSWNLQSYKQLDNLLSRSDLIIRSELDLFFAVEKWLKAQNFTNDRIVVEQLLSRLRLTFTTPVDLLDIQKDSVMFSLYPQLLLPRLLQASQFQVMSKQALGAWVNTDKMEFVPRIYANIPWVHTFQIYKQSSLVKFSFKTPKAMEITQQQTSVTWNGLFANQKEPCLQRYQGYIHYNTRYHHYHNPYYVKASRSRNRNISPYCPDVEYPMISLFPNSPRNYSFDNIALITCLEGGQRWVKKVVQFKGNAAPLPNESEYFLGTKIVCTSNITTVILVIRPNGESSVDETVDATESPFPTRNPWRYGDY